MLLRIPKEKKQLLLKESSPDYALESMASWVRKIEQSTLSIASRLSAVEKRLSPGTFSMRDNHASELFTGSVEHVFSRWKENKHNAVVKEASRVIDIQLGFLHEQVATQEQELQKMNEKITSLQTLVSTKLQSLKTFDESQTALTQEYEQRLHALERREPFSMRLGSLRIPLEITGIIGGILAFIIAVLLWLDQRSIVLSPWFLLLIGVVLLGSAVGKSIHNRAVNVTPQPCVQSFVPESIEQTRKGF